MSSNAFPTSEPLDVNCRYAHGGLLVRAEEGLTEARVDITPRDPDSDIETRFKVALNGRSLSIEGPKPSGRLFDLSMLTGRYNSRDSVDIELVIPTGSSLKVSSLAGDIESRGRLNNVDIGTGASTITLADLDGDLRLRYGTGPATVGQVGGRAELKSGSSELSISSVTGAIDAAFGTGSLSVGTAHSTTRLRAGTGSARIARADGDVDLLTGSGDLSVGLRPGYQARLDVVTGTGHLHTDMPIESSPGKSLGSLTIKARTGSGDVAIRRTAELAPANA